MIKQLYIFQIIFATIFLTGCTNFNTQQTVNNFEKLPDVSTSTTTKTIQPVKPKISNTTTISNIPKIIKTLPTSQPEPTKEIITETKKTVIILKKEDNTTVKTANPVPTTSIINNFWKPNLNSTFQIQFTGKIDLTVQADIFELDLFDTTKEMIDQLHKKNKKVFCYINVGAWEDWRPDKNDFPASILGNDYDGWPGENWLDIRQLDIIGPIMQKRFDLCKQKGFDGIEPDNMNNYTQKTGFNISYQDQIKYNIWLAGQAHKRGLPIGLKNSSTQLNDLLDYYDWATIESCYEWNSCEDFKIFTDTNKPVFQIEYDQTDKNKICAQAKSNRFSVVFKKQLLDDWFLLCN